MRKYYKPVNIRKRDVTAQLSACVDPWALLDAFMLGARSRLAPELQYHADAAISERSVARYLELCRLVDERTQLYSLELDEATVWCERQLATLLKKFPFPSGDVDLASSPRETAFSKWQQAETQCYNTNQRLSAIAEEPSWLPRARELAHRILGDLSPGLVMRIINLGSHGPGSTRSSRGNRVSAYYKFADLPYSCTRRALPYAYAAITSDEKWLSYIKSQVSLPTIPIAGASLVQVQLMYLQRAIEVEDCDKIAFVPKDCQTDRPMAVGSSLNVFLQLGVKSYMEERLASVGIDLTDQSKNQRFAHLGSKFCQRDGLPNENQFSTVDLTSASDTISIEIVRRILPAEWFAFLSDLKHDTGLLPDGSIHQYHKFSAMGNGFTFPLESLIFFCVAKAATEDAGFMCTPQDITVFGDDIIIRRKTYDAVHQALAWSGFSINSAKSFIEGPFKESCGSDFFNGHNVRPFYLKRLLSTREDIYFVANSLMRIFCTSDMAAPWYQTMYDFLLSHIPEQYLSYGPMDGDSSYLNTPYQVMCRNVTRPFLLDCESKAARQAGMLGEIYQNTPVVVRTLVIPNRYHARHELLYMMSLRRNDRLPRFEWVGNKLQIVAETTTYATRRESNRRLVVISSVLNWDAEYTPHQVVRAALLQGH